MSQTISEARTLEPDNTPEWVADARVKVQVYRTKADAYAAAADRLERFLNETTQMVRSTR